MTVRNKAGHSTIRGENFPRTLADLLPESLTKQKDSNTLADITLYGYVRYRLDLRCYDSVYIFQVRT